MNAQIMQDATFDYKVGLHRAGINDLKAAEAKYHLICLRPFTRSTTKTRKAAKDSDLAMVWLCKELQNAAENGQVLQLNDVWDRYVKLAEESGNSIPQSYLSRRSTFKEHLPSQVSTLFNFFKPFDRSVSETLTL